MFAPLALDEQAAIGVVERLRQFSTEAGRDPDALGIEARLLTQVIPEHDWPEVVSRWTERHVSHIGLGNRIIGGSVTDQIKLIERAIRVIRP